MTETQAAMCPVCNETVALDDQGSIRWHQDAETPENAYHLRGCAGAHRSAATGRLVADASGPHAGAVAPRYTWVVRDSDDDPWILLGYRWTSRRDALGNADHWLHHHEQVKTVEVIGDGWAVIE